MPEKPRVHGVKTIAQTRLFHIEAVDLIHDAPSLKGRRLYDLDKYHIDSHYEQESARRDR